MKNILFAFSIACCLYGCTESTSKSTSSIGASANQNLFEVAKEINKKCPIATDENTRMDSATVFNEYMITYHYTVHTVSSRDVDLKKFKADMEVSMNDKYANDPQLAIYRDNKIAIAYDYKDKVGEYLCYFVCGSK